MNNQQATDKAGSPRRLRIMKNDYSIYGILADSEERGRSVMEMSVYATCILSVAAAIFQFIGQPTPDPFAGFDPAAQPAPIVSHHARAAWDTPELSRNIEQDTGVALRRIPRLSM